MKRLVRNTKDAQVAGICSGLGDYFDKDPVIFRIIFIGSLFTGGLGILAYLIGWVIIPKSYHR
tara:strand:- start:2619 stop:2807 length:189 start_codon:yes stop_codon:yes gene_type:complete